jgi:TonB family protein
MVDNGFMLIAGSNIHTARLIFERFLLPMFLSAVVTFVLLFIMQMLISDVPEPLDTEMINMSANVVTLDNTEKPREMRRKVERVMPSEPPVELKDEGEIPIEMISNITGKLRVRASLADIVDEEISSFRFSSPISDLVPIRIVHPFYPFKAQVREIEGQVLVEFTVAATGKVLNPRVVSSTPEELFDKAALKAIQGFLFRAPNLDGISFEVPGMRLMFYFKLDDGLDGIAMSDSGTSEADG